MEIGYRIIRPSDVGAQNASFAQISLWRSANWGVSDGERGVTEAIGIARECRSRGIRTVYHPLEYPMSGELAMGTVDVMKRLAEACDLGIIIHDEGGADGRILSGAEAERYKMNVRAVSSLCPVSIENSYNSVDILRFWERFVIPLPENVSITLDIGHLELAGIDSPAFVRDLPERLLARVRFVHMHHHDKTARSGVADHQPLRPGCREIEALKMLRGRKQDLRVIVELDAAEEGMRESLELLGRM